MKAVTTNTEKKVSTKKVVNKGIESKSINLLNAVKGLSEKQATKKGNYKVNVLDANKALKVEKNSLGAYLDVLLKFKHLLCPEFQAYLVAVRVDNDKLKYEALNKVVRTSKGGKYGEFYTLQGLQKVCFPK